MTIHNNNDAARTSRTATKGSRRSAAHSSDDLVSGILARRKANSVDHQRVTPVRGTDEFAAASVAATANKSANAASCARPQGPREDHRTALAQGGNTKRSAARNRNTESADGARSPSARAAARDENTRVPASVPFNRSSPVPLDQTSARVTHRVHPRTAPPIQGDGMKRPTARGAGSIAVGSHAPPPVRVRDVASNSVSSPRPGPHQQRRAATRPTTAAPDGTIARTAAAPTTTPEVQRVQSPTVAAAAAAHAGDRDALLRALSVTGKTYRVRNAGRNKYTAECGDLAANILCGCFAQYYAFDIDVDDPQRVIVRSNVPCGGFWGGIAGMIKNDEETKRIEESVRREFQRRARDVASTSLASPRPAPHQQRSRAVADTVITTAPDGTITKTVTTTQADSEAQEDKPLAVAATASPATAAAASETGNGSLDPFTVKKYTLNDFGSVDVQVKLGKRDAGNPYREALATMAKDKLANSLANMFLRPAEDGESRHEKKLRLTVEITRCSPGSRFGRICAAELGVGWALIFFRWSVQDDFGTIVGPFAKKYRDGGGIGVADICESDLGTNTILTAAETKIPSEICYKVEKDLATRTDQIRRRLH